MNDLAQPVSSDSGGVAHQQIASHGGGLSANNASTTRHENVVFADNHLVPTPDIGDMSSGDWYHDAEAEAELGSFLSRPVNIRNYTWTNSIFDEDFFPWEDYFMDAVIQRKLQNFARISCKLKVKFVLNASPFIYGSVRACYFPLRDQRSDWVSNADQVPFSQTLGTFLEPQSMTSAELTLPFFWPNNWLNVTRRLDFRNMGRIHMLQYATLRSANAVASPNLTISVYAWAEDVKVMGLTVAASLQSKTDEYETEDGVISAPATAVANVAGALSKVPVIGSFATATARGASMVAGVAKLFGYSNPPVIEDGKPMQNKTFHAFANAETRMPIDRLCLDPKNEVTMSPSVSGIVDADPLTAQQTWFRESFLQGAGWTGSNGLNTAIWSTVVAPQYEVEGFTPGGGSPAVDPVRYITTPPMAYFARMFRYWRGGLRYRFKVVKSKYHTGRLIISWDPAQSGTAFSADTETACFTKVFDITMEDEITVTVPYRAVRPLLATAANTRFSNSTTPPAWTINPLTDNGILTVRVQTVLSGPVVNPEVTLLTFVSPAPDFEFAVPMDIGTLITVSDPNAQVQSQAEDIAGPTPAVENKLALITTGEVIRSLRPLLHRSSLSHIQPMGVMPTSSPNGYHFTNVYLWRIPRPPGRDSQGYWRAATAPNAEWNYTQNHPIDWVLNCFGGYRGSVNFHFNPLFGTTALSEVSSFAASRVFESPLIRAGDARLRNAMEPVIVTGNLSTTAGNLARSATTTVNVGDVAYPRCPAGQAAMSLTNPQTQTALSVNVPQFWPVRFLQAFKGVRDLDPASQSDYSGSRLFDTVVLSARFTTPGWAADGPATYPAVEVYVSAGVDFQPLYFVCTPRLFATTFPSPVG